LRRQVYGFNALVAILTALTLSGPATAGEQRTFLARSKGMITIESMTFPVPNGPPLVNVKSVGEGQSVPLGPFKVTAAVVIDAATDIAKGDWIYTVENGDQLFVSFVSYTQAEVALLGLLPNNLQGGGFFTIKGGTGRFQGATGSYTQVITFASNPGTGPTTYSDMLAGWITY
jgi:hypothetical protein